MTHAPVVGSRWLNAGFTDPEYRGPWLVTDSGIEHGESDNAVVLAREGDRGLPSGREWIADLADWPGAWRPA